MVARKYKDQAEKNAARNARLREWRASLPEDVRKRLSMDLYARNNSRLEYKIRTRLQLRLYRVRPRGRVSDAVRYLGCTVPEFIRRLELQWQPGMHWDNYGAEGDCWNLNHRRGLRSFDLYDLDQLKQAVHYTNIEPVWQWQNIQLYHSKTMLRLHYINPALWRDTG